MDADSTSRKFYPYANAPEKLVAKGAAERKMAIRKLFGESALLVEDKSLDR